MKILVLHAHTANRGDEAAVKAMVDEILEAKPNANITICINGNTFYPNMPKQVKFKNGIAGVLFVLSDWYKICYIERMQRI